MSDHSIMDTRPPSRKSEPQRWRKKLSCPCCAFPSDAEEQSPNTSTSCVQNQTSVATPTAPGQDIGIPHVPSDESHSGTQRNQNIVPSNGPTTPPLRERNGLFPFQPESAERFIDIVAVHGLGGQYEDTWTWNPPASARTVRDDSQPMWARWPGGRASC